MGKRYIGWFLDPCTFPLMPFALISMPSRDGRLVGSCIKHCKQIPTSRAVAWAACGPLLINSYFLFNYPNL